MLLVGAGSRGLLTPEVGVAGDVIDMRWSGMSCAEAEVRCEVDITCRVLLGTIDKVCDKSGTIHHRHHRVGGRVDSAFDSCLIDTGSNPAEDSHCVKTVGKLFTPTVPL